MAFRPDKALIRGELDNTVRGRVTGRIWLLGREEPLLLDLSGDAWPDVAGTRVTFTNSAPVACEQVHSLATHQTGTVGDITVSNRRKHFLVSDEEVSAAIREGRFQELPWEWRNAVYIEWFSSANGRVVLESTVYEVTISERHWTADADDHAAQQALNMQSMRDFLGAIIQRPDPEPGADADEEHDEDATSEEEWEQILQRSDRLTDASLEALDKFKDDPDFDKKEDYIMGWDRFAAMKAAAASAAETEDDGEETAEGESRKDDPAAGDGVEAEADESDFSEEDAADHPLVAQSREHLHTVMDAYEDLGIEETEPQPKGTAVDTFIRSVMQITGKLAGVLSSWHTDRMPRGMILATTRRCLNWSHEALTALTELESAPPARATAESLAALRPGLFTLRDAITEVRRELKGDE
jgi:hypothetical protein